jgi:hypothetical protein
MNHVLAMLSVLIYLDHNVLEVFECMLPMGVKSILERCVIPYIINDAFLQVTLVPSFTESSSAGDAVNDRLWQMRTRIRHLEQDMRVLHGMSAIIKRKSELTIEADRYAMSEL